MSKLREMVKRIIREEREKIIGSESEIRKYITDHKDELTLSDLIHIAFDNYKSYSIDDKHRRDMILRFGKNLGIK